MTAPQTDSVPGVAAVVILAAGKGTRMKSERSKLLHEVAGRPMLAYAIDAAAALQPQHLVVVVGHQREQVVELLADIAPQVTIAVQEDQLGTGHAVQCGLADLGELDGDVVVTYGDVPLLSHETLAGLLRAKHSEHAAATVLTALVDDPFGYGRVVRGADDGIDRIVEQRNASETERAIREINSGIYAFDAATLRDGLGKINANNQQGELLLTDVIAIERGAGLRVTACPCDDVWQTEGVNDRVQLARMSKEMNRRIVERWMREGVTVIDPDTTWVDDSVTLAPDVTLLPNTQLHGATTVAAGATIGPDTTLTHVEVGPGATIIRTHGSLSTIGPDANVGPFAYLRPGTELAARAKIGTFVEAKNAKIGEGAKVPHLCYCGDAIIDEHVNIGAGTIFANYDGAHKWHTHVGKHGFVGSNSVLVAPVDIGDGAFVAAGSAVTDNVTPGSLAIARGRQRNAEGWVALRKPGSAPDQAAQDSDGTVDATVEHDQQTRAEQAARTNQEGQQ